jgi:uncharacterized protein (DUF302 family)
MSESCEYGYTKTLEGTDFNTALERVTAALKEEGFGVLTEIDVQKTLKEKIGVSFRRYRILGACNPVLAHQALSCELQLGLLLPCNVVVYEDDEGRAAVSLIKPAEMFKVVRNPELEAVAGEVDAKIQRVFDAL